MITEMEPLTQGVSERAGAVQCGEEKAQGDLICVYKYLTGGSKE